MRILITKIIMVMVLMGISAFAPALSGQTAREIGNKQYVRVAMKSGEILIFEYRSFLEMNYALQQPDGTVYFGEKRVLFKEQESCTEHSISLDNLQEIEFLGIAANNCTNKKDWLFKIYLLDLDRYEGFFERGEYNTAKTMNDYGIKGQVLNKPDTKTLNFDDIEKIRFFAR
jgi:hypothetical protein